VFNTGVLTIVELCRTVLDIIRFNYTALDVLVEETANTENLHDETLAAHASRRTVREYLAAEGYSDAFRDSYLRPFLGIMWNTTAADTLLELPIGTVVRLMYDHGFLGLSAFVHSPWQTIRSGGFDFMDAMIQSFPAERIHPNLRIVEATRRRKDDGVSLRTANKKWHHFEHVIFAIPGEAIVQIAEQLIDPYDRALLRKLRVTRNLAVLHSDKSVSCMIHALLTFGTNVSAKLMPNHERSWSSCNYITSSEVTASTESSPASSITYSLNSLQQLPESIYGRLFVTLNPFAPPHPQHVQAVWEFTDFEIDSETLRVRDQLVQTNCKMRKNVSFCAHYWMGHGFYEDATTTGLNAAAQLGANTPFQLIDHATIDRQPLAVQSHLLDKIMWIILELIHICILSLQVLIQLLQLACLPRIRWTTRQGRAENIHETHGKTTKL
jgi:predicted NAD/FAD-binding protein